MHFGQKPKSVFSQKPHILKLLKCAENRKKHKKGKK